jgi:hypothetical protein
MSFSPLDRTFLAAAGLLLSGSTLASAQGIVTHRFELPSTPLNGSITFITFLGPHDGCVVDARVHLEFTTGGSFTANDLELRIGGAITPNFPEWVIQGGADLGWGSTPGTHVGDLDSALLNGAISSSPALPWSLWDVSFGPVAGSGHNGVTGQFTNSYIEIDYLPACRSIGTTFCNSNPNSTGVVATIAATGDEHVAGNDVALAVYDLPHDQFGYFLMSASQGFVPLFGGGQGNLCLGAPQIRFNQFVLNPGTSGRVDFAPDLTNLPQGILIQAGETWNFQYWHRDVNPGPTSNTSDGLAIAFL